MILKDCQLWITGLGLSKHPEGGYYKEIYRSPEFVSNPETAGPFSGKRNLSSSIYFLLPSNEVSHFHRLKSDELWYYHAGSPLTIYIIDTGGDLKEFTLGIDIGQGEEPQIIIPQGSIFGAAVCHADSFSLVSCMVSPGFDFADFELFSKEALLAKYPRHEKTIMRLT